MGNAYLHTHPLFLLEIGKQLDNWDPLREGRERKREREEEEEGERGKLYLLQWTGYGLEIAFRQTKTAL